MSAVVRVLSFMSADVSALNFISAVVSALICMLAVLSTLSCMSAVAGVHLVGQIFMTCQLDARMQQLTYNWVYYKQLTFK